MIDLSGERKALEEGTRDETREAHGNCRAGAVEWGRALAYLPALHRFNLPFRRCRVCCSVPSTTQLSMWIAACKHKQRVSNTDVRHAHRCYWCLCGGVGWCVLVSSARGMYEQGGEAASIRTATWSGRSAGRARGVPVSDEGVFANFRRSLFRCYFTLYAAR